MTVGVVVVAFLGMGLWLAVLSRRRHARTARLVEANAEARRWEQLLNDHPAMYVGASPQPSLAIRHVAQRHGPGPFLGVRGANARWTTAPSQQAVLVLGPPRSGKTSGLIIPAILSFAGPVVSTSTKPDVFSATRAVRSLGGRVWLFDPTGSESVDSSITRLQWSPVKRGRSWDETLQMAAAMVDSTISGQRSASESHWAERAGTLLAALLFAASSRGQPIRTVHSWILQHEVDVPYSQLEAANASIACDILRGLERASENEIASIFSTAAMILSAYNSDTVLGSAEHPNFDPDAFVRSTDTLYITIPSHQQRRLAPLVVGLLEEIRDACYVRERREPGRHPNVLWALDEVAKIAPLASLPAIVSEGGGQGLQVMACLQDLSQARDQWGEAGRGFLTLFGTKLILGGLGDIETLTTLSQIVGTRIRNQTSVSRTVNTHDRSLSTSFTYAGPTRELILDAGQLSRIPYGAALLLQQTYWDILTMQPWYNTHHWMHLVRSSEAALLNAPTSRMEVGNEHA